MELVINYRQIRVHHISAQTNLISDDQNAIYQFILNSAQHMIKNNTILQGPTLNPPKSEDLHNIS
jgi:hypothetical protein